MSLPTADDIHWSVERVASLQPNQVTRFAHFRDGLHMDARFLQALERAGMVWFDESDGSYVCLPGIMEAFNARWGPPVLGVCHEIRKPGEIDCEERAAVFATIPAAQAAVAFSRPPRGQEQGARAYRKAHQAADVVAVSSARQPSVHPWHGSRVIPGENPIGEVVQKLRR